MKILKSKQFLFLSAFLLLGAVYAANCYGATTPSEFFRQEEGYKDGSILPGGTCASCTKDGSIFPGGRCERCKTPCKDCLPKPKPKEPKSFIQNYVFVEEEIYDAIHRDCKDFAPVQLEWVDFRIKKGKKFAPYSTKLGNYRFRLFGCRREQKNAILNQGRIMQKDMQFIRIFDDIIGSCVPIVKVPNDVCLEGNNQPVPEYIITAEITDYFMNICDEYDWDESKKENARTGSAEMAVTWRITDLSKSNVLWKGTSVGYSEVNEGEYNGELILIERAFADAVDNLRNLPGFEEQLAIRVSPPELKEQKDALIAMERVIDPVKCQYQQEIKQAALTQETPCQTSTCPVCPQCPSCLQQQNNETINLCANPATPVLQPIQEKLSLCPEAANGVLVDGNDIGENAAACTTAAIVQEPLQVDVTEALVEENSGIISSGSGIAGSSASGTLIAQTEVTENSGGSESGAIISEEGNIIDSGSTVTVAEEQWIDVPLDQSAPQETVDNRNAVEESFATSKNSLCIVSREPYDEMSPENLYTVRASIMSVTNAKGKKGAGLIISDQFVLTSADLITRDLNKYDLETINGNKYTASAFRINPNKNVALLLLDEKTLYTPLSLNLDLPEIGKDTYMTLGLLDFDSGEGYLDNNGKVSGYRYSEEKGAEIIVDTFVQTVTIGGALIDSRGTINGLAHSGKKLEDGPDLFIPIETALKSVGLEICGQPYGPEKDIPQLTKPVSSAIETNTGNKEPGIMNKKERK